jgi:[acyl-carrier-protein] S-malonyltransferase
MDGGDGSVTKLAFMFPGQGSFEAGMGRDVAEAVPEAMAVYDAGSAASGLDLKRLCFDSPVEQLVDTEVQQPALVATSLAFNAGASRARDQSRTSSSATPSASSRRSRPPARSPTRRRSASCANAGSRWPPAAKESPGSMAAILGLKDEVVEALCKKISHVWPANYNCPGQVVISGTDPSSLAGLRGGRARGGEARDPAARLGRVPLAARRARRGPPPARDRPRRVPRPEGRRSCRR